MGFAGWQLFIFQLLLRLSCILSTLPEARCKPSCEGRRGGCCALTFTVPPPCSVQFVMPGYGKDMGLSFGDGAQEGQDYPKHDAHVLVGCFPPHAAATTAPFPIHTNTGTDVPRGIVIFP